MWEESHSSEAMAYRRWAQTGTGNVSPLLCEGTVGIAIASIPCCRATGSTGGYAGVSRRESEVKVMLRSRKSSI